jgi:hypothetical protein
MRRSNLKLAYTRPSERICGSDRFLRLTRNPTLASPKRFEPTVKAVGDVVI